MCHRPHKDPAYTENISHAPQRPQNILSSFLFHPPVVLVWDHLNLRLWFGQHTRTEVSSKAEPSKTGYALPLQTYGPAAAALRCTVQPARCRCEAIRLLAVRCHTPPYATPVSAVLPTWVAEHTAPKHLQVRSPPPARRCHISLLDRVWLDPYRQQIRPFVLYRNYNFDVMEYFHNVKIFQLIL